jgi:hypothetical protein
MIFTVGTKEGYDALLDLWGEGGFLKKQGGTVFKTREAAQLIAAQYPPYGIYRVNADWGEDVEPSAANSDRGNLLRSLPVFRDEGNKEVNNGN